MTILEHIHHIAVVCADYERSKKGNAAGCWLLVPGEVFKQLKQFNLLKVTQPAKAASHELRAASLLF
jgi:hypothetical protein